MVILVGRRQRIMIALIGAFAKNPRYQGRGSSHVNPTMLDSAYEEILKIVNGKAEILYADGYRMDTDEVDETLLEEAKKVAAESDVAVVFAGLPERYESEGYDRPHMKMPESHNRLIEEVSNVQKNLVVVLSNGAPVEMPWVSKAKAILETYLGGQAWGGAVADVLFGVVSPSGKLPETFPKKLSDNPSYLNFPGEDDRVEYREGIFVGYRYYDKKEMEVLFPFGHGLSYTTFEYSDLKLDKKKMTDRDILRVSVKVKNTGKMPGKEVVQLYVRDVESSVIMPEKELKAFEKVDLRPVEEKEIVFTLDKRAFAYYNVDIKDWHVESGDFEILIGRSSREIVLKDTVYVESTMPIRKRFHRNSTIDERHVRSKRERNIQLRHAGNPQKTPAIRRSRRQHHTGIRRNDEVHAAEKSNILQQRSHHRRDAGHSHPKDQFKEEMSALKIFIQPSLIFFSVAKKMRNNGIHRRTNTNNMPNQLSVGREKLHKKRALKMYV